MPVGHVPVEERVRTELQRITINVGTGPGGQKI